MSLIPLIIVIASAQSMAISPPVATAESDAAARSYMRDTGVSPKIAQQRIQIESELPPHIERLKARYRERVAFVSIAHLPDQHLVVGLKGSAMESTQHITVGGSNIKVEFEEGYAYTEQEFIAIMKRAVPKVAELIPDATSVDGRPELGLIEIWVQGMDEDSYQPAAAEIEKMTDLKVKLVLGKTPSRNSAFTTGSAYEPQTERRHGLERPLAPMVI